MTFLDPHLSRGGRRGKGRGMGREGEMKREGLKN
jgi:hypothetical protein